MANILYVTTVSRTINAFLIPHIKKLIEMGHNVEIACNIDHEFSNEISMSNIKYHVIDFSRNPLNPINLKAYAQIKKLAIQNQYDLIHVHTPIASFLTRMATRKLGCVRVYTAHGFHFYKGASIINWLIYYPMELIASRWTDAIITINNEDFELATKKFKSKKNKIYKINGIGIDLKEYASSMSSKVDLREDLGIDNSTFIITVIGELIPRKNHKQILETLNQLKNESLNIKVLFAGDGPLKNEFEKYIKDNELDRLVSLLGYRNDITNLIQVSNLIALFSLQEGLPRNLMEGMSAGKPVLCTNIRGNNDLVQHEENGLLVGLNDISDTKEAILKLYFNRDLCQKLGHQGMVKVKKYEIENVLLQMENIYYDYHIRNLSVSREGV